MNRENFSDGWFYKTQGLTIGPISTWELQDLLKTGQLESRHPVWQQTRLGLFFVTAATAVLKELKKHGNLLQRLIGVMSRRRAMGPKKGTYPPTFPPIGGNLGGKVGG